MAQLNDLIEDEMPTLKHGLYQALPAYIRYHSTEVRQTQHVVHVGALADRVDKSIPGHLYALVWRCVICCSLAYEMGGRSMKSHIRTTDMCYCSTPLVILETGSVEKE